METLDGTELDVVISGTGLPQSLLALALSRSGKRILHVDRNDFYGGHEAAFSLSEAESWASDYADGQGSTADAIYRSASIATFALDESADQIKLGSSRAYSIALAPQLVYARSNLPPVLVSSRTHSQLEFQAVGSWFIIDSVQSAAPKLTRVPNGREDIFQDTTLNLKAKRSLMKLLRYISAYEDQEDWTLLRDQPFVAVLKSKFGLAEEFHQPLLALALTPQSHSEVSTQTGVSRIARHLRSIGIFGPGFSAVLPKWGGLAEVSQVACRACAVGGGVYVLNKGIRSVDHLHDGNLTIELSDGEKLTSQSFVGGIGDVPTDQVTPTQPVENDRSTVTRSVTIVSSPMTALFPRTSEGGVIPAGAVIQVKADAVDVPVYILVHSNESGECPSNQCVLYASVATDNGFDILDQAVNSLLHSLEEPTPPRALWRMQYVHKVPNRASIDTERGNVITLPSLSTDLALEDDVMEDVQKAWVRITGESEAMFMKFEAREGTGEDD